MGVYVVAINNLFIFLLIAKFPAEDAFVTITHCACVSNLSVGEGLK